MEWRWNTMRVVYLSVIATVLLMGLLYDVQSLSALGSSGGEFSESVRDQPFDLLRHFVLRDAVPAFEENSGSAAVPEYPALAVHKSDDSQFEYMADTPYYKVYFKGVTVRMSVGERWVQFEMKEGPGEVKNETPVVQENILSVPELCESVDLSYKVETSLLKEMVTLKKERKIDRLIQIISWEGIKPEFEEDGSILFLDENGKEILKILPPFMEDAAGNRCSDVHYESVETEMGHELHKIIDEKGSEWLKQAVYPVVIDPSMQTFEDAWTSSGLQPYGQYFKNLTEYVNPATGYLTVTQTDLVIPGRGLDVVISQLYETPAVFYGVDPYEYEAPPVDVGKGWQLNLPYIGEKYLHLWGGTVYEIAWVNNQFENHKGAHFILVKNQDNTYTLTMNDGMVYEFSTTGKLTQSMDLDQNVINFSYSGGLLTSITDTIGRVVTLSYSNGRLWKVTYNNNEIEYGYDANGRLVWMEDFLNRRTSYSYYDAYQEVPPGSGYYVPTGYNDWLLSSIVYVTGGYTTYSCTKVSDGDYHKYYVTDQRVYDTGQVRHSVFAYNGSFSGITSSTVTVKNESDITEGSYYFTVTNGLITERVVKNAAGVPLKKYTCIYNTRNEVTQENMYNDGSTLSYSNYYSYDNWGNLIYAKNALNHEQFFSYANTSTSGFFVDNTGAIVRVFTNAFSTSTVPQSVHTALLGAAERQDQTFVREVYTTYDGEAHPTQSQSLFGNSTNYLTFSGTFNEKTGQVSFPIDLQGHTVTGNAVLQVTGLPSDDTFTESKSYECPCNPAIKCTWTSGSWSGSYYSVHWSYSVGGEIEEGWASLGPFTHYPQTLGYVTYTTDPPMGGSSHTFTVTTNWKSYPVQTQYNFDGTSWKIITTNLQNTTVKLPVTITDGSHTLYFSESSSYQTKFSWTLYVPVDNTPDTYMTSMQYDSYGNVISITDSESNSVSLLYSPQYAHAYLTEVSATVGTDTITTKATYDSYRGWVTSVQQPKGVAAGSGYDTLYTYDVLGRIIKKEFPLLLGQSQRVYVEAVYDCENGIVTLIDSLRHYVVRESDKLGRLRNVKWYTGTYGSGTLYAAASYSYRYDNQVITVLDPGNHQTTYTYDFLGRPTYVQYPDSSSVSYSYDDTNNKVTFTNGRGYDKIYWFDWLSQLVKVEEEYTTNLFAVTTYQYNDLGYLTSFTDAEGRTTTFDYGSLFGLTRKTFPDLSYEEYAYDNAGNLISFTDAKGNETSYLYDAAYRLTKIQYPNKSVSFSYDLNSNRIRMDDNTPNPSDYVEYTYDPWNRLTSETRYLSTQPYTVSCEYDIANRLTTLTYPDGMEILYSYDDLNRMIEVKRYVDGVNDEILMNNAQYNGESLLTHFDYGNGLESTFSYDSGHRPLTIDIKEGGTSYLDLDYTYDNNGNISQLINGWRDTTSTWHSHTESYTYDGLDRLVSAECPLWSHIYSYDKTGNRIAEDSTTYTVNSLNEVTSLSDGTSFTYDSNGNRISKTKGANSWIYHYDDVNRLEKVEKNGLTEGEYLYDGDGRRIQVTEGSETTTYIYSGLNVLNEKNTVGTATYIYGPYGILAKRTLNSESHTFYYHTDHLGSTRLVTDENKNIVTAATYEPFGESTVTGSESYLYTGKEKDSTNLSYYGARYYDPELARFITRDPLAGKRIIPQSLNLYTYCLNNPVKFIDPAGLDTACYNEGKSRVCIDFYENGKWAATGYYNGSTVGVPITDSEEIEQLMKSKNPADQARAVYLMLLITHPSIQGDPNQKGKVFEGGYLFEGTVGGTEVDLWIIIKEEFESETGDYATTGNRGHMRENGHYVNMLRITVYQGAFQSIAHLYHVIGHEGVHVIELVKTGKTDETNAYKWNLAHVISPFPYPFDALVLLRIYQLCVGKAARLAVPV